MKSASQSGPLFVVGIWRSGTSLLYALLNQHPQIRLIYEGDLPLLTPLFWCGRGRRDWLERWEFWNQAPSRHHLDAVHLPDRAATVEEAFELVYRMYAGAGIWGCKSPNYFDKLITLAQRYPGAKFVIIWRDLGDVCRSIAQAASTSRWFARPGMNLRAILGYRCLKQQCQSLKCSGIPLHELHYEDLVRDPAGEVSAICNFLHIPFDARMTNLGEADRSAIYSAPHHSGVKGKAIGRQTTNKSLCSSAVERKVQRYISFWRQHSADNWPVCPRSEAALVPAPSIWERAADRLLYRVLRAFDSVTLVVYSFVPLSILRSYRKLRNSRALPSPSAVAKT